MKKFKILDVKHVKADDKGRISIFNRMLNKYITLPYPEICSDCIAITANPIDLDISEEGVILGRICMKENRRTCYFIKPYSEETYNAYKNLMQNEDYWIPFFPEQKQLNYCENGMIAISFYKDISFNSNWEPISHSLYAQRKYAEHKNDLDYLDVDIIGYEVIKDEDCEYLYEYGSDDDYDVYAVGYFGDFEEGDFEIKECHDEIWECAKILQKEMLYTVSITIRDHECLKDYTREIIGLDAEDALNIAFQAIIDTEKRNIDSSSVDSYRIYQDGELLIHVGSWRKH